MGQICSPLENWECSFGAASPHKALMLLWWAVISQRLIELFSEVIVCHSQQQSNEAQLWAAGWYSRPPEVEVPSVTWKCWVLWKNVCIPKKALQLHKDSSRGRGNRDLFACLHAGAIISASPSHWPRGCLTQSIPLYLTIEAATKMQSFACPEKWEDSGNWARFVTSSLLCDGRAIGPIFRDEIMK